MISTFNITSIGKEDLKEIDHLCQENARLNASNQKLEADYNQSVETCKKFEAERDQAIETQGKLEAELNQAKDDYDALKEKWGAYAGKMVGLVKDYKATIIYYDAERDRYRKRLEAYESVTPDEPSTPVADQSAIPESEDNQDPDNVVP